MSKGLTIFSHGKEGSPDGTKIQRLSAVCKAFNYDVIAPDYQFTFDPEERVQHLIQQNLNTDGKLILVGSSMGGYVSTVAAQQMKVDGLFLMAPALYFDKYNIQDYSNLKVGNISVVHGWGDDVIPIENSIRFCREHKTDLHLLDGDHSLNAPLDKIELIFREFLKRI